jgi:hypothetical protein
MLSLVILLAACKNEKKTELDTTNLEPPAPDLVAEPIEIIEFGYNLNDYEVVVDTVKYGDSFGWILEKNKVSHQDIYKIVETVKDSIDVRRINTGKKYTLLRAKDSLQTPQVFIYQPNNIEYWVIDFKDSIYGYKARKPVSLIEKTASGVIAPGSNLSLALDEAGLNYNLVIDLSTIYAWTIDFCIFVKIVKSTRNTIRVISNCIERLAIMLKVSSLNALNPYINGVVYIPFIVYYFKLITFL